MNKAKNKLNDFSRNLIKKIANISLSQPAIIDQFTGLPTLISFFPQLRKAMFKGTIGMLYIDIVNFTGIEALYGRNFCNQILFNIGCALKKLNTGIFNESCKLGVCSLGGDDSLIFLKDPQQINDYQVEYIKLKDDIENSINKANLSLELNDKLSVHLVYTEIKERQGYQSESIFYSAIKETAYIAKNYRSVQEQSQRNSCYFFNQYSHIQ